MSENPLLENFLLKAEMDMSSDNSIPAANLHPIDSNTSIAVKQEPHSFAASTNTVPVTIPGNSSNNVSNGVPAVNQSASFSGDSEESGSIQIVEIREEPTATSRFVICPTELPAELKEKTLQMADALLRL